MAPRSKRQELRIQHSWHISRRRHAPFARGPLRPKASGRPTPTCSTSSRRTMRRRGDCGAPLALATWHDTCAPCPLAAGCGTPCAGCAFHVALRHIGGALIGLSTHATPPESQWQHGAGALRGCGGDSGKAGSVCGMGDLRGAVDGVRQRRGQHGRIMTKRLCHLLWGCRSRRRRRGRLLGRFPGVAGCSLEASRTRGNGRRPDGLLCARRTPQKIRQRVHVRSSSEHGRLPSSAHAVDSPLGPGGCVPKCSSFNTRRWPQFGPRYDSRRLTSNETF